MSMLISDRIIQTKGRSTGFDYLRVILAVSIVCWHSGSISYGTAVELTLWHSPLGVMMRLILPMFFALSGFLVAGSLDRCKTLISFYGLRFLRIFPALIVEVTLSALILGSALTSDSLSAYFSDPIFSSYFLNILGDIHYALPGLFTHNPLPNTVNGQLWTVPYELQCYLVIGALAVLGLIRRPKLILILAILAQCVFAWHAVMKPVSPTASGIASGPVLVLSFVMGLLIYLYRHKLLWDFRLFAVAMVIALIFATIDNGTYCLPFFAAYMTVYIGLANPRKIGLLKWGDYSYGIYLYGFPVQQAFASLGPATHHWYVNIPVCLSISVGIAALSWNFIEKPMLGLRRYLPPLETKWLSIRPFKYA